MRGILRGFLLAVSAIAASCTQLPVTGPAQTDIMQNAAAVTVHSAPTRLRYAVVDINGEVATHAVDLDPGSLYKSFGGGKGRAPEILVGNGDVLQLTVFEARSGGLFIPVEASVRPGNFVQLPPQAVGHDGVINVPYAGPVQVAGKSLAQIERDIENKLDRQAIEPKVIATFIEQNATTVSVVGEVNTPKKVRITQNGERVLDMIAQAGGIRFPGYETFVSLQRGGRKQTVYFNTLVSNPEENIYARPGDTIYVYREPRRFVAFGAVASGTPSGFVSQQFPFDQERVSLAEGVAKAGGLLDDRADPGRIFLYRIETREMLRSMGADLAAFPPGQTLIPTVYRANFRDPAIYFYAQRFPLRGRDIIYVSNADSVEVTKALGYALTVTSTVAGLATNAAATRAGATYVGSGTANVLP